jgi:tetratricopeptide (TPR) repeat protein
MDFNARTRIAELQGEKSLRQLQTMVKQSKYKDKLDHIYGTMGNIYLRLRDTTTALEMYEKAIAESTQSSYAKADILVRAGDIYYINKDYIHAQPCYRDALTILTPENEQYTTIQQRSDVLDELSAAYTQACLQDSLQHLSTLPEEQQRAIVEKIIADLIEQEKQDSILQAQQERELAQENGIRSVNTANMLGGGGAQKGEWYFYNPQLIKQGQQEWRRRWGTRTLEDNWRRQNKQVVASFSDYDTDEDDADGLDSIPTTDSTTITPTYETDTHKPEYYLQQIPRTPEALAMSDSLWRQAMIALVYIYRDKVQDEALAMETMHQLEQRNASHPDLLDTYYGYYLYALRYNQQDQAAQWRQKITTYYPTSTQAQIVAQPDYFDKLKRMAQEQDSLYALTYTAYARAQHDIVKTNTQYAEREYPLSPLMPRFLFLNAISVARTEGQEAFITSLQHIVANHGSSEMGAMAKDMLAMMGQGMESQQGTSTSSLADKRGQVTEQIPDTTDNTLQWSEERDQPSIVLLRLPNTDEQALNDLLYEVALFNFSQFLIRDFDMQAMPIVGEGSALRVSGFQNMDEAEWWIGLIKKNAEMQTILQSITIQALAEVNLPLVK